MAKSKSEVLERIEYAAARIEAGIDVDFWKRSKAMWERVVGDFEEDYRFYTKSCARVCARIGWLHRRYPGAVVSREMLMYNSLTRYRTQAQEAYSWLNS